MHHLSINMDEVGLRVLTPTPRAADSLLHAEPSAETWTVWQVPLEVFSRPILLSGCVTMLVATVMLGGRGRMIRTSARFSQSSSHASGTVAFPLILHSLHRCRDTIHLEMVKWPAKEHPNQNSTKNYPEPAQRGGGQASDRGHGQGQAIRPSCRLRLRAC